MSYAIFLYADGLIQWKASGTRGLGGIGITAGDRQNFITHEYSFSPQVLNITSSRVPYTVNVNGMLMYRVDEVSGKWNDLSGNLHNYSYLS